MTISSIIFQVLNALKMSSSNFEIQIKILCAKFESIMPIFWIKDNPFICYTRLYNLFWFSEKQFLILIHNKNLIIIFY